LTRASIFLKNHRLMDYRVIQREDALSLSSGGALRRPAFVRH
jgi:hypothetical protein